MIWYALICLLVGGVINGSFALPTKHIQQWHFENVWLNFAIWGFLILPWIGIFALAPNVGPIYQHIPINMLVIIVIGGLWFGIGQACFAQCLKIIGFGLGFMINIGLGTGLGFLLPLIVLHPEKIFTAFGLTTLLGIGVIVAGLLVSYHAGKQRDLHLRQTQPNVMASPYRLGIILAIIAGFCSAIQNFTFAATESLQHTALKHGVNHLAAATIIWPVFLTVTFFPYAGYMLYLHHKNNSWNNYRGSRNSVNALATLIMGLLWFCSLILYSQASLLIGNLGPVIGWPLFMVLIILASSFWGWRHHEWAHVTQQVKRQALSGIGLLILAVAILAHSATLS